MWSRCSPRIRQFQWKARFFGSMSSNAMKAVLLKGFGGVDQMYIGDCPKPECKSDQLLVRVKATALNRYDRVIRKEFRRYLIVTLITSFRADILQRMGKYPPPQGDREIMGLE